MADGEIEGGNEVGKPLDSWGLKVGSFFYLFHLSMLSSHCFYLFHHRKGRNKGGKAMTKQQAAEFLGVTPRTLTNYIAAGKLSPRYVKGKTSPVAEFDPDELQAFKPQLTLVSKVETKQENGDFSFPASEEGKGGKARISYFGRGKDAARAQVKEAESGESLSDTTDDGTSSSALVLAPRLPISPSERQRFDQDSSPHAPANWTMNLAAKILLTVAEAHALTGLSQNTLRAAIKSGELKALKIGRSQRLRPQDVRDWINAKFGE